VSSKGTVKSQAVEGVSSPLKEEAVSGEWYWPNVVSSARPPEKMSKRAGREIGNRKQSAEDGQFGQITARPVTIKVGVKCPASTEETVGQSCPAARGEGGGIVLTTSVANQTDRPAHWQSKLQGDKPCAAVVRSDLARLRVVCVSATTAMRGQPSSGS